MDASSTPLSTSRTKQILNPRNCWAAPGRGGRLDAFWAAACPTTPSIGPPGFPQKPVSRKALKFKPKVCPIIWSATSRPFLQKTSNLEKMVRFLPQSCICSLCSAAGQRGAPPGTGSGGRIYGYLLQIKQNLGRNLKTKQRPFLARCHTNLWMALRLLSEPWKGVNKARFQMPRAGIS